MSQNLNKPVNSIEEGGLMATVDRLQMKCYECGKPVDHLFDDSRCGKCTRLTVEEVRGDDVGELDDIIGGPES